MAKHGWKGFGIHPHIAENQPHEVNTLGMNHPVPLDRQLTKAAKNISSSHGTTLF